MTVPDAPAASHEALIGRAAGHDSLLVFPDDRSTAWLASRRGHRAIGVVYYPSRDAAANWVPTIIGRRYDAFCYFRDTEAIHPLHSEPEQRQGERDTYPWNA